MSLHLRHALATSAVTALAFGGAALPSANATEVSCDNPEELSVAVTQAQESVDSARQVFRAANRPLGRLVAAKRHEARAELAQSRAAMRTLRRQAGHASSPEERRALHAQLRTERREAAMARTLLTFKRELLAAIKADRHDARVQLRDARAELSDLREVEEGCDA